MCLCACVCVGPDFDGSKMDHNVLLSLPLSLLRSQKGAIAALACREIGGEGTERKDGAMVKRTNPHAALCTLFSALCTLLFLHLQPTHCFLRSGRGRKWCTHIPIYVFLQRH